MRCGTIKCECKKNFYFETKRNKVNCIQCNKEFDVINYPFKVASVDKDENILEGD